MANVLMKHWQRLNALPAGKFWFSKLFGWMVPYTGSISPRVEELRPGYARVSIRDRRRLRNHLRSVHAIALMNLGECVTGLAMTAQLPANARAIITNLSMEFLKKARGPITATCNCPPVEGIQETEDLHIESLLTNQQGEEVARAKAVWRVGIQQKT